MFCIGNCLDLNEEKVTYGYYTLKCKNINCYNFRFLFSFFLKTSDHDKRESLGESSWYENTFRRTVVYFVNRGVSSLVGTPTLMLPLFVSNPKQGLDDASRIIGRAVMTII